MTKLEKLQKAYREAMAKLKELRALETRTAEQDTELGVLMDSIEKLGTDIDTEQRALKLEENALFDEDDDPEDRTITVEDQPIYRGTQAAAFGQQMVDVAMVTDPNLRNSDNAKDSILRLEKKYKKSLDTDRKESRTASQQGFC
jgi:hypothetical protein